MASEFWEMDRRDHRNSRPYGDKINQYITERAEYLIYLRRDPRFPCPDHWDPGKNSAETIIVGDWSCDDCWGFGLKTEASIVPGRISYGNAEVGSLGGDIKQEPGYVSRQTESIHFPRAVYPKENDLVLQCEWDDPISFMVKQKPRPRAVRIAAAWILNKVVPFYWKEMAYFSCGIKNQNIEMDHLKRLLPSKLANLELQDVDSQWSHRNYW